MQSRALFAKDGSTLVEATTGVLDGPPGPGSIGYMQAKFFAVDGSQQGTRVYPHTTISPYWTRTYNGLARNDTIQLTGHVHGVDPRTDVVTVTDTVKLRPDLAVRSLTGPPQAFQSSAVTFQAQVSELNGDVGANADCVMSVDGQPVDQALAIWVDAGHTVSCMFQYSFPTTGTHTVKVSVVNVVPGDWDLSNNSAQTTIQIISGIGLSYQASIGSSSRQSSFYDNFTGQFAAYSDANSYTESNFFASMYGYTFVQAFVFPIQQFSGTVTIDGSVAWQPTFTAQLTPPVSDGSSTCQYAYNDSAYGTVCSYSSGLNIAQWQGSNGQVTYYSAHTDYTCANGTCTQNNYIANTSGYTYGTGAPTINLGTTQQLGITVLDNSGTAFSAQTATMSAAPSGYSFGSDNCTTYVSGTFCYGRHDSYTSKQAFDSAGNGT